MIFDVGKSLLEPATAEAAVLRGPGLRYGAMGRDQAGRDRDSEAVHIEAARWIVGFHLCLQRPADIFQLSVAYLKAISDLYKTGIESVFFRDGVQQRGRKTQDESGVVLVVKLPAGGGKCR